MRLNGWRIGVLLAALSPVILATGCTGSDVLTPGTGNHQTRVVPENAGGRFVDSEFDAARLSLRQIEARPTNPQADAVLGPSNFGLLRQPANTNFVTGQALEVTIPLTSGSYRLERILVNKIQLNDVDDLTVPGLSDPINPTCHDFIKRISFLSNQDQVEILGSDLDDDVIFGLDAAQPGSLTVRVDYPGYLAALIAAIDCSSCSCPGLYEPDDIPRFCMSGTATGSSCDVDADCPPNWTCEDCTCPLRRTDFSIPTFVSLASTYLTFE
jgi:hypothetical protein